MRFTLQILTCCAILLFFREGTALQCRTGQQDVNNRFHNVMRRCRDRIILRSQQVGGDYSSDDDGDDDQSYENESEESEERDFDTKSMNGRSSGTTENTRMKSSGSTNKYEQNSSPRPYPYKRMTNDTNSGINAANDRILRNNNSTLRNGGSNGMANFGQNGMPENPQDQACIIHCFFEELNLVDDKGYPEKSAVTKMMTQDIREPELKEFVKEALTGCYHVIEKEKVQDECKVSQNLLNCLAGKGRQRCDDWDYQ